MSFKEIKKVNVSDEVYKQILKEIIKKNLQPGDRLPSESELVQTFGVSRVSVRAALQRLNGAGIIESVNGGGSFVKNLQGGVVLSGIMPMAALSQYDPSQIVDFRRGIEVLAAELAARFGTEEEIRDLQDIYEEMKKSGQDGDVEEYTKFDLNFHMQIARMGKNPFVMYVMDQLQEIIYIHIFELNKKHGCDNGMGYHRRVLQMIQDHNQNGAREYMNLNLLNTLQEVLDEEN